LSRDSSADSEALLSSFFDTVLSFDCAGNPTGAWGRPLPLKNPFVDPRLRGVLDKLRLCISGESFRELVQIEGELKSMRGAPIMGRDGTVQGFRLAFYRAHAEDVNDAVEHLMLLRRMRQGLWRYDSSQTIVFANDFLARVLGMTFEEMIGRSTLAYCKAAEEQDLTDSNELDFDCEFTTKSGRTLKMRVVSQAVLDERGRVVGRTELLIPHLEHSAPSEDLLDEVERMTRLALTDPLTGVANRHAFDDMLQKMVEGSEPFALLLVDLDLFKEINDTHGHDCGDKALMDLAERLQTAVRDTDVVGRLGGDEFGVILPNASQLMAFDVATRLKKALNFEFIWDGAIVPVRVSIGAAHSEEGAESILAVADRAMYREKRLSKKKASPRPQ
jgi:diguanylate cyclase (GGDEF)-like protein